MQSLAAQTLRGAASLPEAGRALSGRLVSLGQAHDILTRESWSGADLRELVAASLSPSADLAQFELRGPTVRLQPSLALSLALALHELATNALKYGALKVEAGRVTIEWTVEARDDGFALRLVWREVGGPPVEAASRRGFGSRMLEKILNAEPGGRVILEFEPTGVTCVFEAELVHRPASTAAFKPAR